VEQSSAVEPVAIAPAEPGAPLVTRLLFAPVDIVSRTVATRISAQVFASMWRVVDEADPPPRAEDRQRSVARLAIALAIEGACAAVVRGLLEQGSRRQFARVTGRWPSQPRKP
jgi:Protein of unknown function (DUF4235)